MTFTYNFYFPTHTTEKKVKVKSKSQVKVGYSIIFNGGIPIKKKHRFQNEQKKSKDKKQKKNQPKVLDPPTLTFYFLKLFS